jgi:hypothetical protein
MLAAAVSLGGCGPSGPELAAVTGTVTRNGEPLPEMNVEFRPESGRPSTGRTNEQGVYVLQYTSEQAGAIPGQHTVRISSSPEIPPPGFQGQVRLLANEIDSVIWPEPVTVNSGENPIDFDLSQVQEKPSRPRRGTRPSPQPLE